MTIRSVIRPRIRKLSDDFLSVLGVVMFCVVMAIPFVIISIPAAINAWWNEKPIKESVIKAVLEEITPV